MLVLVRISYAVRGFTDRVRSSGLVVWLDLLRLRWLVGGMGMWGDADEYLGDERRKGVVGLKAWWSREES